MRKRTFQSQGPHRSQAGTAALAARGTEMQGLGLGALLSSEVSDWCQPYLGQLWRPAASELAPGKWTRRAVSRWWD